MPDLKSWERRSLAFQGSAQALLREDPSLMEELLMTLSSSCCVSALGAVLSGTLVSRGESHLVCEEQMSSSVRKCLVSLQKTS